ncbi:MAG TPA: hypothetical protein VMW38_06600 [Terriglobia bacterium]|nr:hypothetical protein [Terriglobia bacterium]
MSFLVFSAKRDSRMVRRDPRRSRTLTRRLGSVARRAHSTKRSLLRLDLAVMLAFCMLCPAYSGARFEITPDIDRLIRSGQYAMYNCDYAKADQKFDELIRTFPAHPCGFMYKAEVIWWKALREPTNKALESQFHRYTNEAIRHGETLVNRDPADFYAWYFLASTYGNMTRYYVTVTKSYLGAMRTGMKGRYYNLKSLALKPDCVDCLIGTGSFNYFSGALPSVIKPFAWMLGVRGDREEGLKQLETAAAKGEFGQTEAKTVLLGVYHSELRYDDYRSLNKKLIEEYPANHVFYMWLASRYISDHQYDEGIGFFSNLLGGQGHPGANVNQEYANYEKGRLELQKKDLNNAIASLTLAIGLGGKDKNLLAQAHLMRGFALDLKGERNSALQEYRSVLSLPNVNETQKQAARFSKTRYQGRL